jgi:hypothetical protein
VEDKKFRVNYVYLIKFILMILERTKNEILVRLPANVDLTELQNMLDYLEYMEQTSSSKISQEEVESISDLANKNIWEKFKSLRNIE